MAKRAENIQQGSARSRGATPEGKRTAEMERGKGRGKRRFRGWAKEGAGREGGRGATPLQSAQLPFSCPCSRPTPAQSGSRKRARPQGGQRLPPSTSRRARLLTRCEARCAEGFWEGTRGRSEREDALPQLQENLVTSERGPATLCCTRNRCGGRGSPEETSVLWPVLFLY